MLKYLLCAVFLVSGLAYADTRNEKIEALMKAQGVLEMWQQQIDYDKASGKKHARKMIDQIMTQLNPNEEFKKKFEKAYESFITVLQNKWSASDIVKAWAKYYGQHFTDSELDQLIKFYTSDIGKKEVMASKSAMIEFTKYLQNENKPVMEKALNDYIAELKVIVKDCNCKR